jgi:hypothetical protein
MFHWLKNKFKNLMEKNENPNAGKPAETVPSVAAKPITPVSAPQNVPTTAIQNAGAKNVNRMDIRIKPVSPKIGEQNGETVVKKTSAELAACAKSFEPGIDAILGMVDKAGIKSVAFYARKSEFTREEIQILEKECKMDADGRAAAKSAISRIAARRLANEEAIDYAVVIGVFGQWGTNIAMTVHDIKMTKKEALKKEIMAELEKDGKLAK